MNRFKEKQAKHGYQLRKSKIEVLQVNVGKLCNLKCAYCHAESGPLRA